MVALPDTEGHMAGEGGSSGACVGVGPRANLHLKWGYHGDRAEHLHTLSGH